MNYTEVFRMPKPVKIIGRTSSITNSFINGIIPCIMPSEEDIIKVLAILDMDISNICCAYCGDNNTEWDHFRPLIQNKRATGYISEIHNLVPSCGKCNQSKGNSHWKTWITGTAQLSPASRNIKDLGVKIQHLDEYEMWSKPLKLDFEKIVGKKNWEQHWVNCELLHQQMKESQQLSNEIKKMIQISLTKETISSKKSNIPEDLSIKKTYKTDKSYCDKIPQQFSNIKVGIIAQTTLKSFLESGKYDVSLISFLQSKDYSKDTFYINLPILVKINNISEIQQKMVDHLGRPRYYAKPLRINGETYLLTSQWYDKNKSYLVKWISHYLKQY